MGTRPPPQKGQSPQFSVHVCCGQTAAWIGMLVVTEVVLGLRDIVLDGDPASSLKRGTDPQFSAHVRCGQMAGRIKMPLGLEVGLDPGDC